jgi:hypothetical protein
LPGTLTFIDRTAFGKVHLIFCKHLLETKRTFSNIGVRAELGRFPVDKHYETPCESRDFESSNASFNNGFKLAVCSLARYKIACN